MKPSLKVLASTMSISLLLGLSVPPAFAWPWDTKAGDGCKSLGTTKIIAHAPYRCDYNFKKKLVWLSNPVITDKTRALALVAEACNRGTLQNTDDWDTFIFTTDDWYGIGDTYARSINWYASTLTPAQIKFFDFNLNYSDYISSALTVASTLDGRWSRLFALWNQSISSVKKVFHDRKVLTFGNAVGAGVDPYINQMDSLCNLDAQEIKSKVSIEQRTIYNWVLRNGAGLFPDSIFN